MPPGLVQRGWSCTPIPGSGFRNEDHSRSSSCPCRVGGSCGSSPPQRGPPGTRTRNQKIKSQLRYQLRQRPLLGAAVFVLEHDTPFVNARLARFELATPGLGTRCSIQPELQAQKRPRRDSNPQSPRCQRGALPIELLPRSGGRNRTGIAEVMSLGRDQYLLRIKAPRAGLEPALRACRLFPCPPCPQGGSVKAGGC